MIGDVLLSLQVPIRQVFTHRLASTQGHQEDGGNRWDESQGGMQPTLNRVHC